MPMNQVSREAGKSTTSFGQNIQAVPVTPSRRRIVFVPGSTSQVVDDLHCLLRRRLRVAGLIALAGFATFFVKTLLAPNTDQAPHPLGFALHAVVVAVMTVLCSLLWSRLPFGMRGLRAIELGLFGSM